MAKRTRLPVLGLVMIVKDEEAALPRCLDSVLPFIQTWTICDTGSSDGTAGVIEEKLGHLPGRLYHHQWRNFGHNFNLALARARGTARWLLRLDADQTVEQWDGFDFRTWLRRGGGKGLDMLRVQIVDHELKYRQPLIVKGDLKWRYVYPTHEYLDTTGRRGDFLNGFDVHHHSDGANRAAKFERDLELLRPLFRKREPRAVFYVAETHRFMGNIEAAVQAYELRAELEGWEEERWYANYQAAVLTGDVERLLGLWNARPWRHEPLTAAARIIGARGLGEQFDSLFLERPPA